MVCLDRSDIFHESKSVLAGASGATVSACRWTAGLTSGRLSFSANSRCVLCRSGDIRCIFWLESTLGVRGLGD